MSVAFAEVVIKRWGREVSALSLTAVPMLLSSLVLFALAALFERERTIDLAPAPIAAVLYLAVVGSAVAFSLFFWVLKHVTVTRLSLVTYAIPVVAVTVGTIFLDEPLTLTMVVGAGLVIAGAALVMRRG
jgi:drug/metabolite transporter (DMT)-like permease